MSLITAETITPFRESGNGASVESAFEKRLRLSFDLERPGQAGRLESFGKNTLYIPLAITSRVMMQDHWCNGRPETACCRPSSLAKGDGGPISCLAKSD